MDPLGISLPKTGFYLPSVDRSRPQTQRAAKTLGSIFGNSHLVTVILTHNPDPREDPKSRSLNGASYKVQLVSSIGPQIRGSTF